MPTLFARIDRELAARDRRELTRKLQIPVGEDFCSNDYFCLAKNSQILNTAKLALDTYGYGSTSSRFIRGERDIFTQTENNFAQYKSCERALLFNSGYAANIGSLSCLIKKTDFVLSDENNHASIKDGLTLSSAHVQTYKHIDINNLVSLAQNLPKNSNKFLVTESLFSMNGDIAPLDTYAQICRDYNLYLIIDEAHSVGLYGRNGSGLIDYFGVNNQVTLSINGMGKAFGCLGAFACGPEKIINYVKQNARTLIYSTALPPLAVLTINEAIKIIHDNNLREKLFANILYLENILVKNNLIKPRQILSPIFPIITHDTAKTNNISKQLAELGFDVKAIRFPTVPINQARLRITTNISHDFNILKNLVTNLVKLL